ncbi:MAG: M23 family metallopeptidase [Chloroflexi bacterium]|nr:M23 family metallopeptidase [Chloroflexota bacterium]
MKNTLSRLMARREMRRLIGLFLVAALAAGLLLAAGGPLTTGVAAQTRPEGGKPLGLPVAAAPGPSTWLLGQPYGNTIGAFLRGDEWYRAGQRLHFGIDFSMLCGTPLVAVGDGEVLFVDDMGFGSAPHNLLIRHDAGVVSLYGHLLDRAPVQPGQRVAKGEVVGYSGDPDETCTSRPHLHFELRSLDYQTTYNPVAYIDANWHMLASIGSFAYPMFQQDLDNARRWMSLDDQPDVRFGGAALNLYVAPYPDFRSGTPVDNPPLARPTLPLPQTASLRTLTFAGCCAGAWWSPERADRLFTIDGAPNQRGAIFYWDVVEPQGFGLQSEAPPPFTSADGTVAIAPLNEQEFALRRADGSESVVNTGGSFPSLSADNSKLLTQLSGISTSIDVPADTMIRVANADGSEARVVATVPGGSARWLDDHRLLVILRRELMTSISVIDATSGATFDLGAWERVRSLSIAPGGGRLMFYTNSQSDPPSSGVYTIETREGAAPQRLSWFGSWRWRDADSVYYLPFEPDAGGHTLRVTHVPSGEDRALTDPAVQPFLVANGDWSVSPDGTRIAFLNARDMTTWLIEMQ